MIEKLIEYRRALHKIPEISFNEYKTSAFIKNELSNLGLEYKEVAKTGIVSFIKGESDFTIAFRADIDGLAITESNDIDFKSEHEGFMHACGHDFHMALLLGIAFYYKKNKAPCNILLIFQPAEEGGAGALKMLDEDVLRIFKFPDLIFGLHVNPEYNYDQIAFTKGIAWAGSCEFEIEFICKGGHGALPHTSEDLLFIFSQFYFSIQAMLSRKKDIKDMALLTIGKLKGFDIPNVLTNKAISTGTFRFFSEKIYKFLSCSICSILDGLKLMYNFNYLYKEKSLYIPVINNEKVSDNLLKLISSEKNLGFNILSSPTVMISDDFGYFLDKIPGIYFFLGVKSKENQKLHTSNFDPDEKALENGFNLYKYLIENYNKLLR
ncbi:MAG: M20 family metallopeptidase [Exilispira sp.]